MYKLMEFQRHQKPYLPSTTTPTAIAKPEYSTSSTLLSATASPSASSSNLYSGPIVSSRTSTMSDYTSSRFTDNAALSVPATPLLGSSTTANVPYRYNILYKNQIHVWLFIGLFTIDFLSLFNQSYRNTKKWSKMIKNYQNLPQLVLYTNRRGKKF